jgi:DNA-binding Lrp family transcriptional regulator
LYMEQILKVLESNARTSLEELAAMTGKTTQEVAAYLDECEEKHIINGYRTLVDWERAGVADVQALIDLRVTPRRDFGFDEIAARLADFSEVDSVLLMSGGYDLSLTMRGKSFQEIALFVAQRLSPLEGVLSTATHFVLRTYKKDGVLYGKDPIDERECQ